MAMAWSWKGVLLGALETVLFVIVYGLLIFFGLSAVTTTLVAFLVGWHTRPHPGEFVELAIFYDLIFLATLGMTLDALRRTKQNRAPAEQPSRRRWLARTRLRHPGFILPFCLAALLTLAEWAARLVYPAAIWTLHGLAGVCWALVVYDLMLTVLYWRPGAKPTPP